MNRGPEVPRVSVVVPSFNHEQFVEQAVRSALNQTMSDLEVVVLDDGSTDTTPDIVQRIAETDERVRYFEHPGHENLGRIVTLNAAVGKTKGTILTFLASDDYWEQRKLELQVKAHENGADLVFGKSSIVDVRGRTIPLWSPSPPWTGADLFEQELTINVIRAASVSISRNIYERVGCFSEDQQFEDLEMWLRCLSSGTDHYIAERIASARVVPGSASQRIAQSREDVLAYASAVSSVASWDGLPDARQSLVRSYERSWIAIVALVHGDASSSFSNLEEQDWKHLFAILKSFRTLLVQYLADTPERWMEATSSLPIKRRMQFAMCVPFCRAPELWAKRDRLMLELRSYRDAIENRWTP